MVAFLVAGLQVADTRKLRSVIFMTKHRRGPAAVSAGSLEERSQFINRRVPCSNRRLHAKQVPTAVVLNMFVYFIPAPVVNTGNIGPLPWCYGADFVG